MSQKKGFTLIELLVVIAIIALLLAIILPALRRVKEAAKSLYCQTNTRGLVAAWHTYASENDDNIPGSWNYHPDMGWGDPWDWAWSPWDPVADQPTWTTSNAERPISERHEGIQRGSIWPYIETFDSYHCPSDKSAGGNFRSYSMPDSLNGKWSSTAAWDNILKLSRIQSPGDKYVFIEENDPRGYNINSWVIDPINGTASVSWSDPMALWHFSHNNFAFADGHTEEWKWSQETLEYFGDMRLFYSPTPKTIQGKEDLQRVLRSWP